MSKWGQRFGSHSNATSWQETLFNVRRDVFLSEAIYRPLQN